MCKKVKNIAVVIVLFSIIACASDADRKKNTFDRKATEKALLAAGSSAVKVRDERPKNELEFDEMMRKNRIFVR